MFFFVIQAKSYAAVKILTLLFRAGEIDKERKFRLLLLIVLKLTSNHVTL